MRQTRSSNRIRKRSQWVHITVALIVSFSLLLVVGCVDDDDTPTIGDNSGWSQSQARVDDWQLGPEIIADEGVAHQTTVPMATMTPTATGAGYSYSGSLAPKGPLEMAESDAALGFSTGGAKDIGNFRENINNGYLPLPTDVTYEGLFYDYYFDTGEQESCQKLFCPSYSYAVTRDPFSGEIEYYLSVGLNSGMKESDFERKKLNLVLVLDISDSMNSAFNSYYYDRFGNRQQWDPSGEDSGRRKIEVAKESIVGLLDHLNDDDRFGMVLFNNTARVAKPLNLVSTTDMEAIKGHIMDISANGGTQMSAGMRLGTELFDDLWEVDPSEYENRIIFLTDAMPNMGETSEHGLLGMTKQNAGDRLFSTFIGIGVDFNTELIEYITKIKGANYYSVHSASQFKERMDEEFEFMVTPLVFDLDLRLEADGYRIEKVYGSPEADEATGELMHVNTLFPSKQVDGEVRGGLVLLKLKKTSGDAHLTLKVSYENRNGKRDSSEAMIDLEDESAEFFDNSGIRKGVILARYADLLKNWLIDERRHDDWIEPWEPRVDHEIGIPLPPPEPRLGQWERQSMPLTVADKYERLFEEFAQYFDHEMEAIGDQTLEQELDILEMLSHY